MEINQAILYNKQLYSIMSITNYDIVNQKAVLELIKQI